MHYLVTGAAGFIGSHLTDKLIEQGHTVTAVDNLLLGHKEFVHSKANFVESDIRDLEKMKELCKGVDGIFHLAADPRLPISIEDPRETHDVNVTGTLNMLIAAREQNVKKFVFSSTCALYEDGQSLPLNELASTDPESPYGLHKKIGEQYCRIFYKLFSIESVCLRYFNVYGPRKTAGGGYPMVIPIFLDQKSKGQAMTIVGDGEQTRDYVHVSDVVRANILAMESAVGDGRAYNISSGNQQSVNAIANIIGGETQHIPQRAGEMRFLQGDSTKAKKELHWEAIKNFEEGMEELKEYWLKKQNEKRSK